MPHPAPRRRRPLPRPRRIAALAAAFLMAACSGERAARRTADEAIALYNQGKYAEALPLLEKAMAAGLRDGTVVYQIGYCKEKIEGKPEARQALWGEAAQLLEKEVAEPGGATLERLYYLTSIHNSRDDFEKLRQYARQAVERFEKGDNPNALSGEDWFRLGRLHDFLSEPGEAEAAYRRSVSAFTRAQAANPAYQALAAAKVADLDYAAGRYESAVAGYGEAMKTLPDQVQPFRHAVALLAVARYEEAASRFTEDRDEATVTEAQYGADVARKAQQVAPLVTETDDPAALSVLTPALLEERLQETGEALRAARLKHSVKPGDPLPAEVADRQRRFIRVAAHCLVSGKQIQDLSLKVGVADLIRR